MKELVAEKGNQSIPFPIPERRASKDSLSQMHLTVLPAPSLVWNCTGSSLLAVQSSAVVGLGMEHAGTEDGLLLLIRMALWRDAGRWKGTWCGRAIGLSFSGLLKKKGKGIFFIGICS